MGSVQRFSIVFSLLIVFLSLHACGPNLNKIRNAPPAEQFEFGKELYAEGDYSNAKLVFERVSRLNIISEFSDSAQYMLAESYYKSEEYILAQSEYERLTSQYSGSPLVKDSMFKIGMCNFEMSRRPELDQQETTKAIRAFRQFQAYFPGDADYSDRVGRAIVELYDRLARKSLSAGNLYRKMGYHKAAIIYYDDVLGNPQYQDTPAAPEALFFKAECYLKMKMFSKAKETFDIFSEFFPNHELMINVSEKLTGIELAISKNDTLSVPPRFPAD